MSFQTNPYLIWQLLPGLLTLGLGFYLLTRPLKRRESNSLAAFLFGGTVWSFGNAVQWMSPDPTWQYFWYVFTYVGILIIPTAWLFLVVRFTGTFQEPVRKRRAVFLAVPLLTFLLILSNPLHHLFFTRITPVETDGFVNLGVEWGLLFYVHTVYSYILMLTGTGLLVHGLAVNFKRYGLHAYGLILGVLTPLIGNAVYLFGGFPAGFPDPTPITFTVTGVTFAWAVIGSRMFETVPLAHSAIVQNMAAGILVLDAEDMVIDANRAAREILGIDAETSVGRSLGSLVAGGHPFLSAVAPALVSVQDVETPIPFRLDADHAYEARLSRITDNFGNFSGRLIQILDVSQIKRVEADLAVTQETFGSVLDTLNDAYYESNREGMIVSANRAFAFALGYDSKDEVIGKHFRNFVARESIRDIFERFNRLYDNGLPVPPFEYRYRTRAGEMKFGEMVVSPILADGSVAGARGIIRDVTDRVLAERAIAEQKEVLDGLLQNAPFAIVINDLDKRIQVVNEAFEKLFGYVRADVVGGDLDELLSTPDLRGEMDRISEDTRTAWIYSTGKRRTRSGDLVDVEIHSGPFVLGSEQYGTLVFYNDISERLETEAELDRTQSSYLGMLETLRDPYFEADPAGIITHVNQALLDAVKFTDKDEVIGRHFRRVVARQAIRLVAEQFIKVYETGRASEPFDFVYTTKEGEELTSEMVISPIIAEGEVVGTRGILRDVSERIRAEQNLRAAKDEAERRATELGAINRVAEQVSESLDLDDILQSVCKELTRIFPVRNAGIGLLNPDETALIVRAFHTVDPNESSAIGIEIPLEGNAATRHVMQHKHALVVEDAQTDPETESFHELSRRRGTKSLMIVPLLTRGKVIGTIGMPGLDETCRFTGPDIELAGTIASQIASAIDNAALYAQVQTALGAAESDLEIGSQIQSGFFPEVLPKHPGWETAAHFHSARQVSGDFYDVFRFAGSDHLAFVIADVCDKGVGAALFMVLFRSLLRAFSNLRIEPGLEAERLLEIILKTNNYVAEIHGRSSMFATVFFGILDPDRSTLYFVNGGHEAPAVIGGDGALKDRLMPTGPAVGLFPDMPFEVRKAVLDDGDFVIGFTDGITDARNDRGESFSEERLLTTVQDRWSSIFSMLYELQIALKKHIGTREQFDDITLLALRRMPAGEHPRHGIDRPAQLTEFVEMRDFVVAAAGHDGLADEEVFAFKLAAEEILTNIIQYGYEGRPPGRITIGFEADAERAVLTIRDDGTHFSPDEAKTPDIELGWEERDIGGLGLFFVREMMDDIRYTREPDGTNLFVLKKNRLGR